MPGLAWYFPGLDACLHTLSSCNSDFLTSLLTHGQGLITGPLLSQIPLSGDYFPKYLLSQLPELSFP